MRNTFQAAATGKDRKLHIHLNEVNPSILARHITILKIISTAGFNPVKHEDMTFLWDVWYNVEWPETTRARFNLVMGDLINGKLPKNFVIPNLKQLECLKEVWRAWYSFSSKTQTESDFFMKKISLVR